MENQNTVETMLTQAQDDAAMGGQEPGTLAEALGADDSSVQEPTPEPKPEKREETQEEPGWFKRRMEKHDQKRDAEFQRQLKEQRDYYEAQLAPLREESYRREAEKLVTDGEFKTLERALEYVRLKAGAPAESAPENTQPKTQPRNEKGQFTKADEETAQYAQRLVDQANDLREATGVDVMALYNQDPGVKQKINSREWNFLDVYKAVKAGQQEAAPAAPAPVRTSNGFTLGNMSIARMSESQFDKLDDLLEKGGKIDMR